MITQQNKEKETRKNDEVTKRQFTETELCWLFEQFKPIYQNHPLLSMPLEQF